jgi:hypothetical protein
VKLPAHQRQSPTSRAAAASVISDTARCRAAVFDAIKRAGARGLTDQEGQDALGMSGDTYRPRRVELDDSARIRPTGRYRPTRSGRLAMVWVAT